jgi:hypothetical protein
MGADDIVVATPDNGVKGVVKTPPSQIRGAIRAAVAEALAEIPPDRNGIAELAVSLESGVNLVYAHKMQGGKWTAVAYLGSNWSGEISGGVSVKLSW